MNTSRMLLAATAVVALGGPFTSALAQDPSGSADIVRNTQEGHAFQNGGIGKEQVLELNHAMKPYDLRLTFSEGKHNAYVAGLNLEITDARGREVFSYQDAGPLTDVALPAGHYRVTADFGGVKRGGSVDVKRGQHAFLYLHWPRDET